MPDLESYWQSELTEAQEWYRFFMQSQVAVLGYSYGALIAILTFWGSQLDRLQLLKAPWASLTAMAGSVSFAALVVVFAFTESVTLNWDNAIGNHIQRWELAARRLGGDEAYAATKKALESRPVPSGRAHLSSHAIRVLVYIGLSTACVLSLGWPFLAATTILDPPTIGAVLFTAFPSVASVALVPIVCIRRHVHINSSFAPIQMLALDAEARPRLARAGYWAIWLVTAAHLLWLILMAVSLAV